MTCWLDSCSLARRAHFTPVSVLLSKLCNHVHIQRKSSGKMTRPLSPAGDYKAASPFQGCNLSWHKWPSSLLMLRSWVCFQGGCCKTPGVFIEGSKTMMKGRWQKRKFLPPSQEACENIWIPQPGFHSWFANYQLCKLIKTLFGLLSYVWNLDNALCLWWLSERRTKSCVENLGRGRRSINGNLLPHPPVQPEWPLENHKDRLQG